MDMSTESPSRQALAEGYFLDRATIDWMLKHYCTCDMDLKDPRLSPLCAPDLSGLPPAHIHTAQFDPLCDEGKAYADRLKRASVDVQYSAIHLPRRHDPPLLRNGWHNSLCAHRIERRWHCHEGSTHENLVTQAAARE
jgi:acetyl esterase/lipase